MKEGSWGKTSGDPNLVKHSARNSDIIVILDIAALTLFVVPEEESHSSSPKVNFSSSRGRDGDKMRTSFSVDSSTCPNAR